MPGRLDELQEEYHAFLRERGWDEFHTPKSVSMSISIEAGELMELFQWKDNIDAEAVKEDDDLLEHVREEVADIMIYCMSMSLLLDMDLEEAIADKLEDNRERYDTETAREMNNRFRQWKK